MKKTYLVIIFVACVSFCKAQLVDVGLNANISSNSLSQVLNALNNKSQIINGYEDLTSTIYSENLQTVSLGVVFKYPKNLIGIDLDVVNGTMTTIGSIPNYFEDQFLGKRQFAYQVLKVNDYQFADDSSITSVGAKVYASVLLNELRFCNVRMNLDLGYRDVPSTNLIISMKEEGSNNYYQTEYNLKSKGILSVHPKIELEFPSKSGLFSVYLTSGIYFQQGLYSVDRTITSFNSANSYELESKFVRTETALTFGVGFRIYSDYLSKYSLF